MHRIQAVEECVVSLSHERTRPSGCVLGDDELEITGLAMGTGCS